jgi:hypothetical protein
VASQDQALWANSTYEDILKEENGNKCQLCKECEETTDHLTPFWQRMNA